jgi:hypothetical protein
VARRPTRKAAHQEESSAAAVGVPRVGAAEPAAPGVSLLPTVPAPQTLNVTKFRGPDGAPEIVVDGIAGLSVLNGMVKLRFFSAGTDPDDPATATIVLRLVMGAVALPAIQEMLSRLVHDLREGGVIPSPPSVG